MKSITKAFTGIYLLLLLGTPAFAQENNVLVVEKTKEAVEDTVVQQRFKADGIAAVVGDFVVLDSDIDKMYLDLESQGISTKDVTTCKLAGRMLENKLYAHHAIQDSLIVPDAKINGMIDQQLDYMVRELGSLDKVLEFYKKDNMEEFRAEIFEIVKQNQLAEMMQRNIVEKVEITPEEVRSFFASIPEDERPRFGDEVEIAQIVIKPKTSEEERAAVIDRLEEMRRDIVDNGASFSTKAVLYSDDQQTRPSGGKISLSRKDPFVKEFKDAAFSLQEGEVSKPFETEFGFHILTVDKIRGQQVDVRHILIIPEVSSRAINEAKEKVDLIRKRLQDKELSFAEAATEFSDEKETRLSGGQLINGSTGDTRFELTKVDPSIYDQVMNLDEGEISPVLKDQEDRTGRPFFKIITVTDKYDEHVANYVEDYGKIKELALTEKQMKAIEEWQEEKIQDTYIKLNGKYRDCDYSSNWLKK